MSEGKDKLYKLKEKFNNKTKAVIVGNGPSISKIDWDKIQNCGARKDILFLACNRISILFDKTVWRPDIYVCLTSASLVEKQWQKSIDRCLENEKIISFVFDKYQKKSKIEDHHNNILFINNVKEHYRHSPIQKDFINTPLHESVLKSYSATVPLFQICDYLNIKILGVIGQDGYIFESGKNHFDDSYGFEASNFDKTNKRLLSVHSELKRYFNKKDILIYNLSKKSILDKLYPKKNIIDFIKE